MRILIKSHRLSSYYFQYIDIGSATFKADLQDFTVQVRFRARESGIFWHTSGTHSFLLIDINRLRFLFRALKKHCNSLIDNAFLFCLAFPSVFTRKRTFKSPFYLNLLLPRKSAITSFLYLSPMGIAFPLISTVLPSICVIASADTIKLRCTLLNC